jgi:SAM-dependent methyltransferase
MSWNRLGEWWIDELGSDPAYREEIEPLLLDLVEAKAGRLYLDLGCGDGRIMAALTTLGATAIGCDLNELLLARARSMGNVVKALLPDLSWVRPHSFDGALVGLVLEHLSDEKRFFTEAAGAVRRQGILAVVINHPIFTAPESSPIEHPEGEILWRPGSYFGRGYSDEPAGKEKVRFYHRTLSALLSAASEAGWDLRKLVEAGISSRQIERYPEYAGQEHIPRILGARWSRR